MTIVLCSKKPEEKIASISFSGSYASKFGFTAGCKVAVEFSKGLISIRLMDDAYVDYENAEINSSESK